MRAWHAVFRKIFLLDPEGDSRPYDPGMSQAFNDAGYVTPFGITSDAVVFTVRAGDLAVLLVERQDEPFKGARALPGGFVGAGETSQEVVVRKLQEKAGMPPVYLEQLRHYDDPFRDPRGWVPTTAYIALVPAGTLPDESRWEALGSLPPLPFDHGRMVADGVERLRGKLWYSNVAVGLLPPLFTARQVAEVYGAISGRRFERLDNLMRDLLRTGLVEATGERAPAGPRGGPRPELFRFCSHEPSWHRKAG
jgi:8-oxo-dGTP diphosphatase